MTSRGRPRTPDILTPREWEALDLLRQGLSNREIAERLEISLSGAKFHVSEIISKLGVSTREEAASWQSTSAKRWSFAPAVFTGWRVSLPFGLSPKFAAVIGLAAVIALGGVSLAPGGEVAPAYMVVPGPKPTPTPEMPCPTLENGSQVQCYPIIKDELASWAEATSVAPFEIREPRYIPVGYQHASLIYAWTDSPPRYQSRTATIFAQYAGPNGRELLVNQGYGVGSHYSYQPAPQQYRGAFRVRGTEVSWVNGRPIWETRDGAGYPTEQWDAASVGDFTVFWQDPRTGPIVREISPDGKETYSPSGEALGYVIYGPGLPLEELIKIAESMLAD